VPDEPWRGIRQGVVSSNELAPRMGESGHRLRGMAQRVSPEHGGQSMIQSDARKSIDQGAGVTQRMICGILGCEEGVCNRLSEFSSLHGASLPPTTLAGELNELWLKGSLATRNETIQGLDGELKLHAPAQQTR
jgi:hypothetical protein